MCELHENEPLYFTFIYSPSSNPHPFPYLGVLVQSVVLCAELADRLCVLPVLHDQLVCLPNLLLHVVGQGRKARVSCERHIVILGGCRGSSRRAGSPTTKPTKSSRGWGPSGRTKALGRCGSSKRTGGCGSGLGSSCTTTKTKEIRTRSTSSSAETTKGGSLSLLLRLLGGGKTKRRHSLACFF